LSHNNDGTNTDRLFAEKNVVQEKTEASLKEMKAEIRANNEKL
jgi:hypothetical protein